MKTLNVQFTGNATMWPYIHVPEVEGEAKPGQRVVVPTKMKNDGTVTLTIGTVAEVHDGVLPGATKPIIVLLDPARITTAQQIVASLEAGLTPADKTVGEVKDAMAKVRGDNEPGVL